MKANQNTRRGTSCGVRAFVLGLLCLLSVGTLETSCSQPLNFREASVPTGDLVISIGESEARTIVSALDLNPSTYDISGTGPDKASFSVKDSAEVTLTQSNLAPGLWTVTVVAKNSKGTTIGSGSADVTIAVGVTSKLQISLLPLAGTGSFVCEITWPTTALANPAVSGSVVDSSGAAQNLVFAVASGKASASVSLSNGYYDVTVVLSESGATRWSLNESLQIVADSTSAGRFDLTASDVSRDQLMAPQFGLAPGNYTGNQQLEISSLQPAVEIWYTTNGTTPSSTHGTRYTAPITLATTQTIRAVAVKSGYLDSLPQTGGFVIDGKPGTPTFDSEEGLFFAPVTLTFSAANVVDGYLYTLDGVTNPDLFGNGTAASLASPLVLTGGTTTVRVISKIGSQVSGVSTGTFKVTGYASEPTISGTIDSDTPVTVTLAPNGTGETLYYTLDGTVPAATNGTPYSGPFVLGTSATVRAVAVRPDWGNSTVASRRIDVRCQPVTTALVAGTYSTPKTVDLATATSSASIYYTLDGTDPSPSNGSLYAAPFVLENPASVKAAAFKTGIGGSVPLSIAVAYKCAEPVPSLGASTFENDTSLTLSTATPGASINYTLNGVAPLAAEGGGIAYSSPVLIDRNRTLKAIAYRANWQDSTTVAASYAVKCGGVTFDPPAGLYTPSTVNISLTSATTASTIYYTTDGTTPTTSSTKYLGAPFTLSASRKIKAIAVKSRYTDSAVSTASYTLNVVEGDLTTSDQNPLVTWPTNLSAEAYKIEIASDSGFTTVLKTGTDLVESRYTVTGSPLAASTTYYYRIAEKTGGTYGAFHAGHQLRTLSIPMVRVSGPDGDFHIGVTEVTQAQYTAVTGVNPSAHTGDSTLPADTVNWCRALMYCNLLSVQEGLTPVYSIVGSTNPNDWLAATGGSTPGSGYSNGTWIWNVWDYAVADPLANGYRLPTKDQWLYAARGGSSTHGYAYAGSNSYISVGWFSLNSTSTHPVAQLAPNELGLYDMSGNLFEWTFDGMLNGLNALVRYQLGGAYSSGSGYTIDSIQAFYPYHANDDNGFRVSRNE